MAKIINHQTTQVNFTLIPRKPINVDVDTTKLKVKLSDIFENSKTILTQFPEIVILFDPNNQISINILSNFDLENGTMDSGDFVKENYIKKEKFDTLGTLKSAGLKVVYEKGYC